MNNRYALFYRKCAMRLNDYFTNRSEWFICADGFRDFFDLDPGTAEIVLVATKRRYADSLRIGPSGGLPEVRRALFYNFQNLLRQLYRAGYRYIHFEYAE